MEKDIFKKKDRFDLEQEILDCWHVTDDIDVVFEGVMDRNMSTDEISNALLGIKTVYHLKFQRLFETFEFLIRDGQMGKKPIYSELDEQLQEVGWPFPESSEDITIKFNDDNMAKTLF